MAVVGHSAEVEVGDHLERQPLAVVRLVGDDVEAQVDEVLLVGDFVVTAVGVPRQAVNRALVDGDGFAAGDRNAELAGDGADGSVRIVRLVLVVDDEEALVGQLHRRLVRAFEGIGADASQRLGEGDDLRVGAEHFFGSDGRQLGAGAQVEVAADAIESPGTNAAELAAFGEGDGAGAGVLAEIPQPRLANAGDAGGNGDRRGAVEAVEAERADGLDR